MPCSALPCFALPSSASLFLALLFSASVCLALPLRRAASRRIASPPVAFSLFRCAVEGSAYRCSPRPGYKEFIDENILPSDYYAGTPGGRRLDKITRCVDQRTPDISIKGANPMIYKQASGQACPQAPPPSPPGMCMWGL